MTNQQRLSPEASQRDLAAQLKRLESAYRTNAARPVAYLDETSFVPKERTTKTEGRETFYSVTAVVVDDQNRKVMNEDLLDIVGRNYWHTSEALQNGQDDIAMELLDYLVDGGEPIIMTVKQHVDEDDRTGEAARIECLRAMMKELYYGESCPEVTLTVLERRKMSQQRNHDAKIFTDARVDGVIPEKFATIQVSPTAENLLWLPDLVCHAYHRYGRDNAGDKDRMFYERIESEVKVCPVEMLR